MNDAVNRLGLRKLLLSLLSLIALPVLALVNPTTTVQTIPGWMAFINVWTSTGYHELCKGALIAPQWILSAGTCLADPNHYLDSVAPGSDPQFYVKLGPFIDGSDVDKYYVTDDYSLALFHISLPSPATTLPVSTRTATQLQGSLAVILGKQQSLPVYDGFYNPGVTATAATCSIGSSVFSVTGAFCYVMTQPTAGATLFQTVGTVIDPTAANAPATALDKLATIDTTGNQLYLDFRNQQSYPCLEDIGSPVLETFNGSYEIVGVVSRVGMAAGLPICGMSLANVFASSTAIQKFITRTLAQYDFDTTCPAVPKPRVQYGNNASITLSWTAVAGAGGYKVHFTPDHGQVPITTVD
ncbi:MAG TPA: trypsin-like serine protease, partial [Candidatus Acidoferrum sp.]|nr:trypsin-like serine protease [Candidatus Acidoferrum sp.]